MSASAKSSEKVTTKGKRPCDCGSVAQVHEHAWTHFIDSRSISIASVSSTASCVDEDETKVDRDLVFHVKTSEPATERKTVRVFSPPTPLPTPPPRSISEVHEARVDATEEAKADNPSVIAEDKEQAAKARPAASPSDTPSESPIASAARRLLGPNLAAGESSLEYYTRTASALLTGFFLGTFITLCVLSPRHREIANHFT